MQEKLRTAGTTIEHSTIHANRGSKGETRRTSILGDNGQHISRTDGNNNTPKLKTKQNTKN